MDNDAVGINESIWLKNNFNIIPFLIPFRYKSKDFSELVQNINFQEIKTLIIKVINYLDYYDRKRDKSSGNFQYDSSMPY